jgi:CheY-like chemotaxis protein
LETGLVNADEVPCKPPPPKLQQYVKISVRDNGTGMDDAIQQRIFDPFFTTKDRGRGTGLGLASAYGIIKNHGGQIMVDSKMGQGTTFDIYLPASERSVYRESVPEEKLIKGSGTVLLVDDEDMIIDVGKAMLAKLGYRILVASSGKQAIELVADGENGIDLVILDLIMPGISGRKTFDRIREIRPFMPVMLSSGYAIKDEVTEIMDRGCNGFIQKPFNISALSKKIRKILDEAQNLNH